MSQKAITILITIVILCFGGMGESVTDSDPAEEILYPTPTQLREIELLLDTAIGYHFSFFGDKDRDRFELEGDKRVRIKIKDNKFRVFSFKNGKWSSISEAMVPSFPTELTYAKDRLRGSVFFELYDTIGKENVLYNVYLQEYWITNDLKVLVDYLQADRLLQLFQAKEDYFTTFELPDRDIKVYLRGYLLYPVFPQSANTFIWKSMVYKTIQDKPVITVYKIKLDLNNRRFIVNELPMKFSPQQGFEVAYLKAQGLINKEEGNLRKDMIIYGLDKSQEKDIYSLKILYSNKFGYNKGNVIVDSETGEIISVSTKVMGEHGKCGTSTILDFLCR